MTRFGVDALLADRSPLARAQRVGLVTNDAARTASDRRQRTRAALQEAGVPLVRLFGPEHGLVATEADGAPVADGTDPLTGLPVVSLYGNRMRPTAAMLEDLDAVLFDIPDVGARFYTYTWTLYHLLAACAAQGTRVVVCDRPNPLGGLLAEGPILDLACRSFVGEEAIPVRHGLTHGELATLWQRERFPALQLHVIPCAGWDATRAWPATGLPWVPTSPAMPAFACAIWYPGLCLFEATTCSVGRGTDAPFTCVAAPWLDPQALIDAVPEAAEYGAQLQPTVITPSQAPHAGKPCPAVRVSLDVTTDDPAGVARFIAAATRPVALGLALLGAIQRVHPDHFAWAAYPTAANPSGADHFSRLIGRPDLAERLADAAPDERLGWTTVLDWQTRASATWRYPRPTSAG